MKKLLVSVSVLVLLFCMIVPAHAATTVSVNSQEASRGDTVTFDAAISGSVVVGSGSVSVSYDSSVLELVSGSCGVGGAMLATFDANTGLGAFAFQGTGTVSGTLFSVTFKVKDDAPFGTTDVSLSVSLMDGSNNAVAVTNESGSFTVKCAHSYTKKDTTYLASAADCTSPAKYYYTCEGCGAKGTTTFEYGSPADHAFTRQVTTDAYKKSGATCTSKAVYYYCCTGCSAKGTDTYEYGSTTAHSYTKKITTDAYKASDADCDSAAMYYYCCAGCDEKGSATYTSGTALGHTGGSATCSAKAVCTRCGNSYGNVLSHNYNQEVAEDKYLASAATCTAAAKYYKSCVCGTKGSATFTYGSAAAHAYTKQVITEAYKKSGATCTEKAVYYYCCATCSAKGTETFEYGSPAHQYNRQVITDAYKAYDADCEQPAYYYYCCAFCDEKGSATYPSGSALGHTGGTATCTKKAVCTTCGSLYGDVLDHTYTQKTVSDKYLASAASCTAAAKYYKSCVCGEKGTETFESGKKTDHSYTEKVADTYLKTAATCTQKAVYYKSCSVCGVKGTATFEAGKTANHIYGTAWKSNGTSHWQECTKCAGKGNTASHKPGAAATETTAQKCTVCAYVITPALGHTHKYATQWSFDADNHWYACSGCSEKKDIKAHVFDSACDTDCATCGYTRTITHNYEENWKTDESNHWKECACGEKSEQETHAWDEGIVTKEATAEAFGEKTFTCLVCEMTKAEEIDKLPEEGTSAEDSSASDITETNSTAPDMEGNTGNTQSEANGTVIIVIIGAAVIIVGAVVALVVKKKKI